VSSMPAAGKRRALGQHFLRDPAVARAIADLVAPSPVDLVLEIGPGQGALTSILASRAGRFLGLELDPELARRLADRFDIRHADARTWDYRALSAPGGRVLVVGNLPYSASKPILMRLCDAHGAVAAMALMLQREVAERVAAPPGTRIYGALSVLVQLHWTVALALRVPPGAFRPLPRVESAVLHLASRPACEVAVGDEPGFRQVVLAAFGQRRKAVANALAAGLHVSIGAARERLQRAGIDPGRRAETLSLADFARLARSGPGAAASAQTDPTAERR
jgi:16S rRNA (adenine1518-N6/adenine1519-N6)-dimethyltransferase